MVRNGTSIQPLMTATQPRVNFEIAHHHIWGEKDFFTLIAIDPDHPRRENPTGEFVLWLVTNIPKNHVEKGEAVRNRVVCSPDSVLSSHPSKANDLPLVSQPMHEDYYSTTTTTTTTTTTAYLPLPPLLPPLLLLLLYYYYYYYYIGHP